MVESIKSHHGKGNTNLRIHKFIAESGYCSRRTAEELVREGKVFVNKKPAFIGQDVDPERDSVFCDGHRLHLKTANKRYFMFYKPRGVITAMKAQDDRSVVADLIGGIKGRVYPVGRLDRDSEGLLLLTDDGEAAQKLTHPSHEISKTYRVTVKGDPTDEQLTTLRSGVKLDDGDVTQPAQVEIQAQKDGKTVLHITIHEGKNRQIRRMCDAVGLEIHLLKRIAVGNLSLGHLQPGEYRPLSTKETEELLSSIGIDPSSKIIKKPQDAKKGDPVAQRYAQKQRKSAKSVYERRFLKQFGDKKKKK